MHAHDVDQTSVEIKAPAPQNLHKFWIAMCTEVLDHEVVGPNVKTPKAADPTRTAWQPFAVWFWLLSETAHRPRTRIIKGRPVNLARGQIAVSERYLAQKANWSRKAARAFLDRLERFDMVATSSSTREGQMILDFRGTQKGPAKGPTITILTICNYDKYQHTPKPKGTNKGAAKGPARDQNLTSNKDTQEEDLSASKESVTVDSPLAGLNGAAEPMLKDIVGWMGGGGNEQAARNWLGKQVACYGQDAVRNSYSKMSTDMVSGAIVARPLQTWCRIAQRFKDDPKANLSQQPYVRAKAQELEDTAAIIASM